MLRSLALFLTLVLIGCSTDPVSIKTQEYPRLFKKTTLLDKKVIQSDTIIDLPLQLDSSFENHDFSWWLTDVDTIEFHSDSFAAFIYNSNDSLKNRKDEINSSIYYKEENDTLFFEGVNRERAIYKGNMNGFSFTLDYFLLLDSTGNESGWTIQAESNLISEQQHIKESKGKAVFYRMQYEFMKNSQ